MPQQGSEAGLNQVYTRTKPRLNQDDADCASTNPSGLMTKQTITTQGLKTS